jgi:hypothetical protein
MKSLAAVAVGLFLVTELAHAAGVRGHVRKDGAYVQPHVRTNPDRSTFNNYSTKPNINPYTGKAGTRDPLTMPRSAPKRTR